MTRGRSGGPSYATRPSRITTARSTSGAERAELVGDQHDGGAAVDELVAARRRAPAGWAGRRRRSARRGPAARARRPARGRSAPAAAGRRRGSRRRRGPCRRARPRSSAVVDRGPVGSRLSGRNSRRRESRPEATTSRTEAGTPDGGAGALRHEADPLPVARTARSGVPKSRDLAAARGDQPDQRPDQRRLAGAVGAEQATHLAGVRRRGRCRAGPAGRRARRRRRERPSDHGFGSSSSCVRLLRARARFARISER